MLQNRRVHDAKGGQHTGKGLLPAIGPEPDNNLLVHQTIHITINANGEVTSTVDNESIGCM